MSSELGTINAAKVICIKSKNLEYVKEYYGYSNEKAKSALDILSNEQIIEIKRILSKGGKHGKH